MKLVFFSYLMLEYAGGLANYFIEVSTGLKKRYPDLDITILTFDEKAMRKIIALYSLYFFGKQDQYTKPKETLTDIRKKLQKVQYEKVSGISELKKKLATFDMIYTTNNFLEMFLLKLIGFPTKKTRVVAGFHVPVFYPITPSIQSKLHNVLYASPFYSLLIKKTARLHVLNSFDEKLLKKTYGSKVVKIYNPFDFDGFFQQTLSQIKNKPKRKKFQILWTGRLTEQKGVNDLLEIIDQVNNVQKENVTWTIAGDGELRQQVINEQTKWDNVNFLGYIPHANIASLYKTSNLFISTSKWESFPYNLLEAQSFGLPVICYNIHGCNDIIIASQNGHLVKTKKEFAKKIIAEIKQTKFTKSAVKKFIHTRFDEKKIYQNLYQLLTN